MRTFDANLEQFATEKQWAHYLAYFEHGSERKAADALGCDRAGIGTAIRAIEKKATAAGYAPDQGLYNPFPMGRTLGKVTIQSDATGKVIQTWARMERDDQADLIRETIEALKEDLPKYKPVKPPKQAVSSLMTAYPVGDHHFGMLSWHEETGADYNISIGEQLLTGAMDHLVSTSPASERALIVLLGDFLHYDSMESVTPASKHQLDSDSRYQKMIRAAIKTSRFMIRRALQKHLHVTVIVEVGNHDPSGMPWLAEALNAVYEDDPRVTVDTSPRNIHYYQFGKCMIATTHGDKMKKPADIPLIMATDQREMWAASDHRYIWTGHIHHDQVKDFHGCRWESFRILPPVDAYAAQHGYRSGRDMKAIVLHEEYGEVARHIVNPAMLEAA